MSEASETPMMMYDDDNIGFSSPQIDPASVQCFMPDDISSVQGKSVSRIADILEIPRSDAEILLRHFRWNVERVLEKCIDGDRDAAFAEAGLGCCDESACGGAKSGAAQPPVSLFPATSPVASSSSNPHSSNSNGNTSMDVGNAPSASEPAQCEVCYDDGTDMITLSCGHHGCHTCWANNLKLRISEGEAGAIHCMSWKCRVKIPDSIVEKLVPELMTKYHEGLRKAFVENRPGELRWCPNPRCNAAVSMSGAADGSDVTCKCGFKFCFYCQGEAHAPVSCDDLKKWRIQCKDDSQTSKWISVNTKDCPKCNRAIEKNGGCNHMTCRACTHEFCWICFADWKNHSSCREPDAGNGKQGSTSQQRAALETYLKYYNKYELYERLKRDEATLLADITAKENEVLNSDEFRAVPSSQQCALNFNFLRESVEQLIESRRVLKFAAVFSFYYNDSLQRSFFDYKMETLEETSTKLTTALTEFSGLQCREKLISLSNLVKSRIKDLVATASEISNLVNSEIILPSAPVTTSQANSQKRKILLPATN